jgi:transcriptional regulator GlxA family with amidase domain
MQIAIPLYDRFTALDAVGPYEVLSRLPGARVEFVAAEPGVVRADTRMLGLSAELGFDDVPEPEIVVVPGGIGSRAAAEDEQVLDWIRRAHETSRYTTSVCTGALILSAAGVLDGLEATTHWICLDQLERPVSRRVVEQGKVITAAGVSAGIDMALTLAERLMGADVAQAIQLGIEYDPEPPFDAGSPDKAPENVVELVRAAQRAEEEAATA